MTSAGVTKKPFFEGISGSQGQELQSVDLLPVMVKAFKMAGIAIGVWVWGYLGFSVAWIFVALFFHVASEECRKYKESKKTYALHAVLNEREAIQSRVDDHSSWVYFPDVEKAEWFNKVVRQMWPYIGEYIKDILKHSVEQSIQSSLPSNLKSFKFESIDIGDTPPRVDGVKVYTDPKKGDEIICDVDLKYMGDANIRVAIKGVIAGIKSLSVSGTMRVIMKPLTSEIPIIGGMSVFFLNKPLVDFNLTAAANLLDAPLLNKSLRSIVEEQLAYYLVLPHRVPIQLASNIDFTLLKYPLPQGVMRLEVVEAKDLKRADSKVFGKGKSDPYCIVVVGAREMRTKVSSNTINPVWNQHFQFVVDQKHGQFIDLQIFDRDMASNNDDSLGLANIDIEVLAKNGFIDLWYPLEDVKTGQVYIRAMWMYLTQDIDHLTPAKNQAKKTGFGPEAGWSSAVIVVVIDNAKNLPLGLKSHKERNSFVRMKVGESREQTSVRLSCNDPVWNESFQLLVNDPESDCLTVEVCHRGKADKTLATVMLALNEVLTSEDMTLTRTFKLLECGENSQLTVRLTMRILMSDVSPRWSGGLGGLKLGRVSSIDTRAKQEPPQALAATAASNPVTRTERSQGSTRKQPSIGMPIMMRNSVTSEDQGELFQRPSSRETTPPPPRPLPPPEVKEENVLRDGSADAEVQVKGKPLHESTPIKELAAPIKHLEGGHTSVGKFGRIQLTIRYSSQRGHLIVVIHQCSNLIPCDRDQLADPYIRVYLLPDRSSKKRTKMIKNSLNPVFDETFEWPMALMEGPFRSLDIAVKNDVGLFSKSRTDMGRVVIQLGQIGDLTKAITAWYDLEETKTQ